MAVPDKQVYPIGGFPEVSILSAAANFLLRLAIGGRTPGGRDMAPPSGTTRSVRDLIDLLLPLFLTALLVALCIQLLLPFVGLLMWTIILAICFNPMQEKLLRGGWRPGRAATLLGAVIVALILIPTAIAAINAASSIPPLVAAIQSGTAHVRPPPPSLEGIPLVGGKLYAAWGQAANDFPAFLREYGTQLKDYSSWLLKEAGGMFASVLLLVLAVILAAVTLAYAKSVREFFAAVFTRVTGTRQQGEHLMNIIVATVRSVANGVVGVAFIQAVMCGIAFFALGMPGAGLVSLIAWLLAIVQIPGILFVAPGIIYAFSAHSTTVAIIATVWLLFAGTSDTWLKPLMIGRGLEVPMPVILLGVIGGVIAYGLVGLFIGAVILAVGYVLFREWLGRPVAKK